MIYGARAELKAYQPIKRIVGFPEPADDGIVIEYNGSKIVRIKNATCTTKERCSGNGISILRSEFNNTGFLCHDVAGGSEGHCLESI